ncbi:MAG: hypothetical protein WB290_06830 [Smithella sp.]
MNKQELISFIQKLIDREIQQHKATGFTLWALIAFAFYIGNKIFQNGLIFYRDYNFSHYFFIVSSDVMNIGYSLVLIFLSLLLFSFRKTIKTIKPRLELASSPIVTIPNALIYLFYAYLNFRAAAISDIIWIYLLFSIFYFYNAGYNILKKIIYFVKRKNNIQVYKEVSGFENWTESSAQFVSLCIFIIAIFCLFLAYVNIQMRNIFWNTNIINQLIIFSIQIFILNVTLIIILYKIKAYNILSELTELEKDIFVKNLSVEEIKERLEFNFFATLPSNFLLKHKNEMKIKLDNFLSYLDSLEKQLLELKKQGNSKEIKVVKKKAIKQYSDIMHIHYSTLHSLIKMQLSPEENLEFDTCLAEIKTSSEPVLKKLGDISKV